MPAHQLLDAAGRPRSPATMPGHHAGRVPPNKGRRYPADPPTVDEIVAVMRQAGDTVTAGGCVGRSLCCGAQAFGATRLSRSQRPT